MAEGLLAAHAAGNKKVENHGAIRFVFQEGFFIFAEGFGAISNGFHFVSGMFQKDGEEAANGGFIIHGEDAAFALEQWGILRGGRWLFDERGQEECES